MGYLSGSSPHIRSGAVSALSVLVHNDVNLCLSVPDLLPSVLELTHSKAIEVIKVSWFLILQQSLKIHLISKFSLAQICTLSRLFWAS